MTLRVQYPSRSGELVHGETAGGDPSNQSRAPGVVVLQEWWGVNAHIKSITERLAREGFICLAPDLYDGHLAKDATEAGQMMKSLDWPRAIDHIDGAVRLLRERTDTNGRIAIIGFCMGGALTLAAGCAIDDLAALVPFYGLPSAERADYRRLTAPVLAHVASHDDWVTVDKAKAVQAEIAKHGRSMEVAVYDANHAFFNDTRPEVYSKECADLAWERSLAFLRANTVAEST